MATGIVPLVPFDGDPGDAAMQQPWRKARRLSSVGDHAEAWLDQAGFDRAPWLAIALAGGIAAWFVLPGPAWWVGWIAACLLALLGSVAAWGRSDGRQQVRRAVIALAALGAIGTVLAWGRSEVIGAAPIAQPQVVWIDGRVLARENRPAEGRVRLILAYRDAETGDALKVRVNVAPDLLAPGAVEGARVRLRAPDAPGAADGAGRIRFRANSLVRRPVGHRQRHRAR